MLAFWNQCTWLGLLCIIYWINVAWHGVDQPLALLRCCELQAAWILCLSTLPHSETLISKWNERQTSSLTLGKTLLTFFSGLGVAWHEECNSYSSPSPGYVCLDALPPAYCLSPLLVKLPHILNCHCLTICSVCCLCSFFSHTFSFHSTCYEHSWIQLSVKSPVRLKKPLQVFWGN